MGFRHYRAFRVEDAEFRLVLYDLVKDEGLSLGGSSGANPEGARRPAKAMRPGRMIVTLLCDQGDYYALWIFKVEFLKARGLPTLGRLA